MKKLDQLIGIQNKLEAKREGLLAELASVEEDLKSVQKLRHEAEKIVSKLERQQAKLDSLLEDRIPKRKRKTSQEKGDDFVASLPQSHEEASDQIPIGRSPGEEGISDEESYQDVYGL